MTCVSVGCLLLSFCSCRVVSVSVSVSVSVRLGLSVCTHTHTHTHTQRHTHSITLNKEQTHPELTARKAPRTTHLLALEQGLSVRVRSRAAFVGLGFVPEQGLSVRVRARVGFVA